MQARCPCGSVTLEVEGEPIAHVWCHCDDCQHAHAAPFVPRAIVSRDQLSLKTGTVRSWLHNVRTMVICDKCGNHLFSERDGSPYRGLNAGLLQPGAFQPQAHIHCAYTVIPVRDDLPHYRDLPLEVGGSGELVDW